MASRAEEDDGILEMKGFKGLVYTRKRFRRDSKGESSAAVNLDKIQPLSESGEPKVGSGLVVESSSPKRQRGETENVEQPDTREAQQDMVGREAGNLSLLNRVSIDLASGTKQQKRELKMKLESELETIRNLLIKIDSREEFGSTGGLGALAGRDFNNGSGTGQVRPEVAASVGVHTQQRPWDKLKLSVMKNSSRPLSESVEREKRTPKANQFYNNSEFLLGKDKFPSADSNRRTKSNGQRQGSGGNMGSKFLKSCSSLLEKLMKHKNGWVFNKPVDVVALNLHDYFDFIKHPMDLGTIKQRLHMNFYNSPKQFAEDVRLTFQNAMTYNPKGHDVHTWAEQLLKIFEDRWVIIESDYNREMKFAMDYEARPNRQLSTPARPPPLDMRRVYDDRSEPMRQTTDTMPRPISVTPLARTPAPKKPKAKDPFKRDMTADEKQKLIENIQNLPPEKLDNVAQIIQKNTSVVTHHNDEIEVDINTVDNETLWTLDRMVTNYKKNLSKRKRKAELAIQSRAEPGQSFQDRLSAAPIVETLPKEIETGTGERNILLPQAVQGENQGDTGSRLSSSSSSSSDSGSSSSDSDSGSSSSSGSDAGHSS